MIWVMASPSFSQVITANPGEQALDQQAPIIDLLNPPGSPVGALSRGGPTELGISLGAFTLYPELDLLAGYDSNVFATSGPGVVGSMLTVVKPSLELRSEWLNHYVRVLAAGGFGFYPGAPSQNYQNYILQADGRLDITQDMYVTGSVGVRRQTYALGTPNVATAQSPTVVDYVPIEISFYQRFNRFFYQATVAATRYWYNTSGSIIPGGLPGDDQSRWEFAETLRLGYEVTDDLALWVAPSLSQISYIIPSTAVGESRNSSGWGLNVGATYVPSAKTQLEGFVGLQSVNYPIDGSSTSAFVFGLRGVWNGYEPLTLRPSILRSINSSALSNYQNYVSTALGLDFSYDIHDSWQLVGGVSFIQAEYTPAFGVPNVSPRTDYFWRGSIGLLYSIRPQLSIGPLYEYSSGSSTDVASGGPSYSRNMFSIRLVARQ